jgi:hypothetical protein
MLNTARAVIRDGKIELVDSIEIPEGTRVLVTVLSDDEADFWLRVSQKALDAVWNNPEDDVYAELLQR